MVPPAAGAALRGRGRPASLRELGLPDARRFGRQPGEAVPRRAPRVELVGVSWRGGGTLSMATSALRRRMKNLVHNYSDAEIKVREATSNDPWGPASSLMSEIADLTFHVGAFPEIMSMLWRRLGDQGRNWRHVYKALTLLDYLLKTGSEKVAQQCKENMHTVRALVDFHFIDQDSKDQGANVRHKAGQLLALLRDEERMRQDRVHALRTKERMSQVVMRPRAGLGSAHLSPAAHSNGEDSGGSPESPVNPLSRLPWFNPDLEETRPHTSEEEELQVQLALARSRPEAENAAEGRRTSSPPDESDEDEDGSPQRGPEPSHQEFNPVEGRKEPLLLEFADVFGAPLFPTETRADSWDVQFNSGSSPGHPHGGRDVWSPSFIAHANHWGVVGPTKLLGEMIPSTKQNGSSSPDVFDVTEMRISQKDFSNGLQTPELFLDPHTSSLANLGAVLTAPSRRLNSKNPFHTPGGLSPAASANPFLDGEWGSGPMRTASGGGPPQPGGTDGRAMFGAWPPVAGFAFAPPGEAAAAKLNPFL
ncbi:epsin-3-like isoform X1 [Leucoraja erinacea]|uniref:epsin-3-like isoform X1 n=2 Tax=Leucoraja erinaceus TaxID=7782 RepID=UPI0024544BB1|nr:epsin-3-like isoform X1 [Leucoraja erinacea]